MGLFDFLKKKEQEPDYDPTNLQITDLKKGFILDYDMRTWEVKGEYTYDWGKSYYTREFKLDDGTETIYLHIDDNDDLSLSVSRKIKVRSVDEDIPDHIKKNEAPPKKLLYENKTFYLESDSAGYFHDEEDEDTDSNWYELMSWEYQDDEGKHILSIEQWDVLEFEAAFGKVVKAYEFSNLLPGAE